jgi:hypothetical protein
MTLLSKVSLIVFAAIGVITATNAYAQLITYSDTHAVAELEKRSINISREIYRTTHFSQANLSGRPEYEKNNILMLSGCGEFLTQSIAPLERFLYGAKEAIFITSLMHEDNDVEMALDATRLQLVESVENIKMSRETVTTAYSKCKGRGEVDEYRQQIIRLIDDTEKTIGGIKRKIGPYKEK